MVTDRPSPGSPAFLARLAERYPLVFVLREGRIPPERPPSGVKVYEDPDLTLYWQGPPPRPELLEALSLLASLHGELFRLKERELALEEALADQNRLVRFLLHEIKNPLMALLGALELALEMGEEVSPGVRELLTIAEKSAKRLRDLVEKARDYLSLGEGVRLKSERLDLFRLARQAAEEVLPLARRKGVELRLRLPRKPAPVYGDPDWLYQALLNVIHNAVKYTPPKGRVVVRGVLGREEVGVAVADTGPGIPWEEQGRVFEPFFRASTRGEAEGSGLGLALVKRVLEAHGGGVRLRSRPGKGSLFYLHLPRPQPGKRAPVGRLLLLALALLALARLPVYPAPLGGRAFGGPLPAGEVARLPGTELAFTPEARGRAWVWRSLWGGGARARLLLEAGGVEVRRHGGAALTLLTPEGEVRPTGTVFRTDREGKARLSLYAGSVRLGEERLMEGQGAVLGTVVRRPLLPAPLLRGVSEAGGVRFRFTPVAGARSYRLEVRAQDQVILFASLQGPYLYLPREDREAQARVYAVDEAGLLGYPSEPFPFRERYSFYQGKKRLPQDPKGAEAFLRRALLVFPDDWEAMAELGFALYLQGPARYGEAALLYQKALSLAPNADTLARYGRLLYHQRRLSEAERAFREALEENPRHLDARWGLAEVLLARGDLPQAEALVRGVLRDDPAYPLARFTLAKVLLEKGNKEEAVRLLRAELEKNPDPEVKALLEKVLSE
jgi:signal transduction histidine kinase/TolA-binding protein